MLCLRIISLNIHLVCRRYGASRAGADDAEDNLLHDETHECDSQGDEEQEL